MNHSRKTAASARRQSATLARQASRRESSASATPPLWLAPFHHLRHALTVSMYQILTCRRATQPEWCTLRGRMRALRRIEEAYDRLCSASEQLERAAADLRAMVVAVAADPLRAGNAPAEMLTASRDILVLSARLASMSLALDAAFAFVQDHRRSVARPRPIPPELCSQYPIGVLERLRLLLLRFRRRHSRCLAAEDAPRRVSRGRAPPFASTCPL